MLAALGDRKATGPAARAIIQSGRRFIFLCSHRKDCHDYNRIIFSKLFPVQASEERPPHPYPIYNIQPRTTNVTAELLAQHPDLRVWAAGRDGFHTLPHVTVGATVILETNLDLSIGAVNGALGTVQAIHTRGSPGNVTSITVRLWTSDREVRVRRLTTSRTTRNGITLTRATFPLALGYAITGHL